LTVALRNAGIAQQAMLGAPRPGMTGREATIATMAMLEGVDFLPSLYSHAIGHHGHALGPSINARNMELGPAPARDSILRPGSYRSIELSATTEIPEWNGETLTIPFEDDAHLTDEGYVLFRPPQTSWYLIR
jgi:Xaa-Pro aminopeptidase